MPVSLVDLEAAIRNAIPVAHLEIEDQSSGCGENYAVLIVSEVCRCECLHVNEKLAKIVEGIYRENDLG